MSIGTRIRKAREAKNMSLEDVAKMIGTTRQTVYQYEHDLINIPAFRLKLIGNAVGLNPAELLGVSDKQERIMELFNALSGDGKDKLLEYAEFLQMKEAAK